MIHFSDLENKRILILGYGKEGRATEYFLKHMLHGAQITVADQKLNEDYLSYQNKADVVVKTPGIAKRFVDKPYTTATNIFFELCKGTIIGVTGSKGKSTTASLIYAILQYAGKRVFLVGNIGVPALQQLIRENTSETIWVYEMSSYQLDDCMYSPHISVITNLFPEHMDYHETIENYYRAKLRIAHYAKESDYVIYPKENSEIPKRLKTKATIIQYDGSQNNLYTTSLLGQHNRLNISASHEVAKLFFLDEKTIATAISNFHGLPHRMEFIGKCDTISFYDDAISTSPQSTIYALQSFPKVGCIFLGGQDRGYDFSGLIQLIIEKQIQTLVFFPQSGQVIKKQLAHKRALDTYHILETKDMKEAVAYAFLHTPRNTVCLLSTASPSYSVWKNFEEKGDLFQNCIKEYAKTHDIKIER